MIYVLLSVFLVCIVLSSTANDGRDEMLILSAAAEIIWTCPECSSVASLLQREHSHSESFRADRISCGDSSPQSSERPQQELLIRTPQVCPSTLPDKKLKTQSSSVGMRLIKGAFIRF